MMRFDPTNTEDVEYEQETEQIKYKKMFKVDEIDNDQDDNVTVVKDKIKGETIQTGYINGNNFVQLRIPKRYEDNKDEFKELFEKGNKTGSSDEVKDQILQRENEIFLNWRRNLNQIETDMMREFKDTLATKKDFLKYKMNKITPYEKSIDIWRQLWITVESCELLCIIIDSRNPLFFKNKDLEDYILNLGKKYILIMNKADLIAPEVR